MVCPNATGTDDLASSATATRSGLSYDGFADQYSYVWKTSGDWSGTCRRLSIELTDGSRHEALFRFK